jgi:hypothetical protein
MDFVKRFISRKLLVFVLTPIISGAAVIINQLLPAAAQFTPEQVGSAIQWIVELAMAYIATQDVVDAVEKYKAPAALIAPTNVVDSPLPEDMK